MSPSKHYNFRRACVIKHHPSPTPRSGQIVLAKSQKLLFINLKKKITKMLPKNQKIDTKTLKDATLIINMSYIRYFKKISIIVFFK